MEAAAKLLTKLSSLSAFNGDISKNTEVVSNPAGFHLPFLVCLLESMGYQLRKMDYVDSKSMFRKSTTIVVSCGISGQRCFLEWPEEKDKCNCLIKGPNTSDFFLEAFSNGKSEQRWLEENSSQHCIPFVSSELKSLSESVLHEIVSVMEENFRQLNHVHNETTLASNNNLESSSPNMNIPDIITTAICSSPLEDTGSISVNSIVDDERKSEEVRKPIDETFIVNRVPTETNSTKSTNTLLRRSVSDSGKRSLIPKHITPSASATNLKAHKSNDNLETNKVITGTDPVKPTNPSLKRSVSDSGRKPLLPRQTTSSVLRKCASNLKVSSNSTVVTSKPVKYSKSTSDLKENVGPSEMTKVKSMMQTAKNIITNRVTPNSFRNKKLETNEHKKTHVPVEKFPFTNATISRSTCVSNKTPMEKKYPSKIGAALPKPSIAMKK